VLFDQDRAARGEGRVNARHHFPHAAAASARTHQMIVPIRTAVGATYLAAAVLLVPDPSAATANPAMPSLPLLRRIPTAADIPTKLFKKQRSISGRVVKVTDGDTIRIRHTPFHPLSSKGDYAGKLSENTIAVRIYGVDAPETAHFGNPSQPYADEATDYVRAAADGKVVRVKLLRRDQYGRAVGRVTARGWVGPGGVRVPFVKNDISQSLASRGLATLYTGAGAEYDGRREVLERKIASAQRWRRGMWSRGKKNAVDPAAYKRKIKARKPKERDGAAGGKRRKPRVRGVWHRILAAIVR